MLGHKAVHMPHALQAPTPGTAYIATTFSEKHNRHYNPPSLSATEIGQQGLIPSIQIPTHPSCFGNTTSSVVNAAQKLPAQTTQAICEQTQQGDFCMTSSSLNLPDVSDIPTSEISPTVNPHTIPVLSTTQAQLFSNSTIRASTEVAIPPQPTPLHSDQEPQHDLIPKSTVDSSLLDCLSTYSQVHARARTHIEDTVSCCPTFSYYWELNPAKDKRCS